MKVQDIIFKIPKAGFLRFFLSSFNQDFNQYKKMGEKRFRHV